MELPKNTNINEWNRCAKINGTKFYKMLSSEINKAPVIQTSKDFIKLINSGRPRTYTTGTIVIITIELFRQFIRTKNIDIVFGKLKGDNFIIDINDTVVNYFGYWYLMLSDISVDLPRLILHYNQSSLNASDKFIVAGINYEIIENGPYLFKWGEVIDHFKDIDDETSMINEGCFYSAELCKEDELPVTTNIHEWNRCASNKTMDKDFFTLIHNAINGAPMISTNEQLSEILTNPENNKAKIIIVKANLLKEYPPTTRNIDILFGAIDGKDLTVTFNSIPYIIKDLWYLILCDVMATTFNIKCDDDRYILVGINYYREYSYKCYLIKCGVPNPIFSSYDIFLYEIAYQYINRCRDYENLILRNTYRKLDINAKLECGE
jgi:hypothetical protein